MNGESQGKTRRAFLKGTAAAIAAPLILTSRQSAAATPPVVLPPSPPTTPWSVYLDPAVDRLTPVNTLDPAPTEAANTDEGEAGRASHQRFVELTKDRYKSPTLYEMTAKENPEWSFNPAYPLQSIWGFTGNTPKATTPGPTIFARYGQPMICRIHNQLPYNHVGFGTPEITTHLHNLHTPSESDGFPGDFYGPHPDQKGPTLSANGEFLDHFYPNILAGYDEFHGMPGYDIGDPREALGTLWYHDHTLDFTSPNVYRGMAGFYLIFDEIDSGNEKDYANPQALRLPSYPYDYPLILQDKRFDANGRLVFDQFTPEGVPGDKVTVNGKIEPALRVARRKYRLRFLNGGPTRFYELYLVNAGGTTSYTFSYIANDGNLLPAPLTDFKVRLGVAERADIVVDFSRFAKDTVLYLVNRLEQPDNRGPTKVQMPGTRVLKFLVGDLPPEPDVSRVPTKLRDLRPLLTPTEIAALPVRRWVFERRNGMWAVNGQFFDVFTSRARPCQGSAEVWELVNPDDGWSHPIHIHFEEGLILSRTREGINVPVPAHERGRKDVYVLGPAESMKVLLRFRDFLGKYPMHCHNLVHEDHAMMIRWDIIPPCP